MAKHPNHPWYVETVTYVGQYKIVIPSPSEARLTLNGATLATLTRKLGEKDSEFKDRAIDEAMKLHASVKAVKTKVEGK